MTTRDMVRWHGSWLLAERVVEGRVTEILHSHLEGLTFEEVLHLFNAAAHAGLDLVPDGDRLYAWPVNDPDYVSCVLTTNEETSAHV